MYNPNVPSSNMGIAPISGQPSQPMGPAPMGPPPPMAGGMPPPPPMAPLPAPSPITEGLGGYGGSRSSRAGFSERLQKMTSPPKPKPNQKPTPQSAMNDGMHQMPDGSMMLDSDMPQPVQQMHGGGMVGGMGGMYGGMGGMGGMYGGGMYGGGMMPMPMMHQPSMMGYGGMGGGFGINRPNYPMGGYNNQNRPQPLQPMPEVVDRQPSFTNAYGSYYKDSASGNMTMDPSQFAPSQTTAPVDQVRTRDSMRFNQAVPYERPLSGIGSAGLGGSTGMGGQFDYSGQPSSNFGTLGGQADSFNKRYDPYLALGGGKASSQVGDTFQPSGVSDGKSLMEKLSSFRQILGNYGRGAFGMADGGEVSRPVEPLRMALGGFIGNESTRDYSYTDPYEELDDLYDDIGGYDPSDPFGDGDSSYGGDDDDDNVVLRPPVPRPAPPVVPPSGGDSGGDDSGGGDDGGASDLIVQELISASTSGSSDPSVPDVAPDFATFTDSIDPYGSLTGQVVSPTVSAAPKAIDAVGAAPVVGAVESGEGEGVSTEVDVLGVNPISLSSSGVTDRGKGMTVSEMIAAGSGNPNNVVIDRSNIPAVDSDFTSKRAGEILDSLNVARPGGSSKTRIEDDGLANAMAAAQQVDASEAAAINPLGSDAYTGVFEPEFVEPTPAEIQASNLRAMAEARADDAANVQPQTFVGGFGADPAPSDIQLEMAPPTDGGSAIPNDIQLDVAPYNSGNLTSGDIADLLANTPGLTEYALTRGSSASPGIGPSTGLTSDPSDPNAGYNPPVVAPSTDYFRDENEGFEKGDVTSFGRLATEEELSNPFLSEDDREVISDLSDNLSGPDGSGTDIFDSYAALTRSMKAPNKGETNLIRNAMAGARHTEDGKGYKKGDLVVEDRFADKVLSGFETALSFLLPGPMDFKAMSQENRNKALQAYYDTGKIVYEEGKPVGFEDKEGGLVRLVPKSQDDTGGDSDGCPPGFRRINGVCTPIQRVAANPATAIEDSISSATLPNTLRPVVRDLVDDDDDEEETSDVGGLTIRRPKYFAGGGAVSEGMGSAIDSFISAMGGSVKKKSNVAPVNMFLGGLVDRFTGRNDYTDPYEELERDYGYDPTDPFGDGDTSYGDDGPSDTVTADTFIGPMQPNVTYQPPAAPVDTGGDETDPFVKNAILSARNYYNDGSVGPTMQNASMLPAAPVNTAPQYGPSVDDRYAIDMTKYVPPGLRDVTQTLFDNDLASFNPVAGIYRAMDASGRIGKSIGEGEEVSKDDMLTAGIETAIPALTLGVGRFLQQPVKQAVGNLFGIDVSNPRARNAVGIKPTFKDLNLAHGTPRTDPFKPEIQVQMADGTTQFMDMFSPDGLIETKFTSGFPEGATVVGDYPFGRFSTDFIGAGEGRMLPGSSASSSNPRGAAFGKGTYLAENPELSSDVYRFIGQNQYKPDGLPKNFNLDAALRQKQGIINKYGSPEEALKAFESGKVISKPDYNSVSQAYFQGAENALNSDNPILSKISSDLMGGMEPSYRAKLEQLKIEKPEEWQAIISNHINERINSIRTKSREDQLAKGQKIVDDPDIQRASNILNKNAMDTRNRVYDEKASYDAMLQIMRSNVPGSTKRATINESKLGRSLDLDSPSAVGDTRIGFDKNVRQDMLDIFGEGWVADRESGMFADPTNPGNLLRGAPNQTDYRTEGAYAPRTVEEMNKLADAGYSHLSFYDGKSREVHRKAIQRIQKLQEHLEGRTLEKYLSFANKNNPQDVDKMTKLYEVEAAYLENEMKKARESLTGLTKNYVFFDDKTMPKITESYAKGGQVGMGLGSL